MIGPAPGSTLPGSSVTFSWTTGTNVTDYRLHLGTTPGGSDIASVGGTSTRATIANVPTLGAKVYATLYSKIGTSYQSNVYSYVEFSGSPGVVTSPASGSTFSSTSVTFQWSAGTNVSDFRLRVGTTPKGYDIANVGAGTKTSVTINNVPSCGDPVYVTLYSKVGDAYQTRATNYAEFNNPVATLSASPSSLNLGNVKVGSSGTAAGKLVTTCKSVSVSGATTTQSGVFSVGGVALPLSIPAHSSAPYTITFSPATSGAASAKLSITSNAQVSSTNESLTGNGVAAHTVTLSWQGSTSSGVTGYNVYRAPYTSACGAFSKINASLDMSTTYADSSVSAGSSYCYAATAVNQSSESGYSNIASHVVIPTP